MTPTSRFTTVLIAAVITAGLAGCGSESKSQASTSAELVGRGEYLTTVGGCQDCHEDGLIRERWAVRGYLAC